MFKFNSKEYWAFSKLEKYSDQGVVRSIRPERTITRATKVLKKIGVTKVSNVAGLDRTGVPNFMTVRPRDESPGISYYNGKGTTVADAHAGALMEAVERHAAEFCQYPKIFGTYAQLSSSHLCVNPRNVIIPAFNGFSDNLCLEWVPGFDLINLEEIYVPLNFVECPHIPLNGTSSPFMSSSNGLASGNNLGEAVCHAICELIERDSQALSMGRTELGPRVRQIVGNYDAADTLDRSRREIQLTNLPRRAANLLAKIKKANLEVFLQDYSITAGIATISCTLVDLKNTGIANAHGGVGAHPDARVALLRAITEACQSRVSCIQGGREDLGEVMKQYIKCDLENISEAFGSDKKIPFSAISSVVNQYINDDIDLMLAKLPASGIDRVIAFDLTRCEVGIPVVRIVMPRAETWPVFHLHTGRAIFGRRVANVL